MLDFNVRDAFYESFRKSGKLAEVEKQAEERGKEIGTKIGKEIGKEENARATAIEMLVDGFALDKIAHYIRMPLEWVQNLKDSTTIT
ncbi:MAG: hypothetical protein FWG64_04600 [Firmicutes bacterium]|nr:hypothetical protein [Bacillota bacterium]